MAATTQTSAPRKAVSGPERKHVLRVQFCAATIWLVFNSYSAAQLLQSSVNKESGYGCLAAVYGFFAAAALIAPAVLAKRLSLTAAMPLASISYVCMVAVNIDPQPAPLIISCASVGISAAFLWSAQSLYVQRCAAAYSKLTGLPVTQCNSMLNSKFYSIFASSGGVSALMASFFMLVLKDATRLLFVYLTIIGSTGVLLMLFFVPAGDESTSAVCQLPACARRTVAKTPAVPASASRDAEGGLAGLASHGLESQEAWQRITLPEDQSRHAGGDSIPNLNKSGPGGEPPGSLQSVSVTSTGGADGQPAGSELRRRTSSMSVHDAPDFSLATKPHGGETPLSETSSSGSAAAAPPPPFPSVGYMLRFLVREKKMAWMMPLIVQNGIGAGLFNGAFLGAVVAPSVGVGLVGVIGACFSFGSSIFTLLFSKHLQNPRIGRRWGFVAAYAFMLTFVLSVLLWVVWFAPAKGEAAEWPSTAVSMVFYVYCALLYAAADSIFQSQVPATLQTFFPTSPDASCAMAGIRLCSALGTSSFVILTVLLSSAGTWVVFAVVVLTLALSAVAARHLHRNICSVDYDGTDAAAPTAAPAATEPST